MARKKPERKSFEDMLKRVLSETIELFSFGGWGIRVDVVDAHHSSSTTLMDVSVAWEYLDAYIRVYYEACKDLTLEEFRESMIHEFVHIAIDEVKDYNPKIKASTKHMERVTQTLAKTIYKAAYVRG